MSQKICGNDLVAIRKSKINQYILDEYIRFEQIIFDVQVPLSLH